MQPITRALRSRGALQATAALKRSYAVKSPAGQPPVPDTEDATSSSKLTSDRITYSSAKPQKVAPNVSKTNEIEMSKRGVQDGTMKELAVDAEERRTMQAPNRNGIWSRSQTPREAAMSGPRFEQTIMEMQPRPYAAIELIHKQPVRWIKERSISCDGGGGPLGHPRIFINVDKPQICWCTYCGTPFANTSHRKTIEALPNPSYPLDPKGDPMEVKEPQKATSEPLAQR